MLISTQIPAHTHTVNPPVSNAGGNATDPTGGMPAMVNTGTARAPVTTAMGYTTGASTGTGTASNTGPAGGSQPHENRPPSLAVTFIIALTGIFPSRN